MNPFSLPRTIVTSAKQFRVSPPPLPPSNFSRCFHPLPVSNFICILFCFDLLSFAHYLLCCCVEFLLFSPPPLPTPRRRVSQVYSCRATEREKHTHTRPSRASSSVSPMQHWPVTKSVVVVPVQQLYLGGKSGKGGTRSTTSATPQVLRDLTQLPQTPQSNEAL